MPARRHYANATAQQSSLPVLLGERPALSRSELSQHAIKPWSDKQYPSPYSESAYGIYAYVPNFCLPVLSSNTSIFLVVYEIIILYSRKAWYFILKTFHFPIMENKNRNGKTLFIVIVTSCCTGFGSSANFPSSSLFDFVIR